MTSLLKIRPICIARQPKFLYKELIQKYHSPNHGAQAEKSSASLNATVVDLRSDTVTLIDQGMKQAMLNAPDEDVFDENKNINKLESRMATLTGKESALFVISGTMGNLVSIISHCRKRGSEIIVGDQAHIFRYEQANVAQFGGIQPCILPNQSDGTFDLDLLNNLIKDQSDPHIPSTGLICVENTHGFFGGKILPTSWQEQLKDISVERGIPLHLDGARIFNASVYSKKPLMEMVKHFDSVSICFSKGLGTPVGTVIAGSHQFIRRAKRLRVCVGGLGKQSSMLAASCLYALDQNVDRLRLDHANATLLARGINDIGSEIARVELSDVQTNMVLLRLDPKVISPQSFCDRMHQVSEHEESLLGKQIIVKAFAHSDSLVRLVTHLNITKERVEDAITKIKYILRHTT